MPSLRIELGRRTAPSRNRPAAARYTLILALGLRQLACVNTAMPAESGPRLPSCRSASAPSARPAGRACAGFLISKPTIPHIAVLSPIRKTPGSGPISQAETCRGYSIHSMRFRRMNSSAKSLPMALQHDFVGFQRVDAPRSGSAAGCRCRPSSGLRCSSSYRLVLLGSPGSSFARRRRGRRRGSRRSRDTDCTSRRATASRAVRTECAPCGTIVVAVGDVGRRPRRARQRAADHQPLVRVHRRRADRGQAPRACCEQPAEELIGQLDSPSPCLSLSSWNRFLVLASPTEMWKCAAGAGAVGERLGHERGDHAHLVARSREAAILRRCRLSAVRQGVGIGEVHFELAVRVLVVDLVDVDADAPQRVDQPLEERARCARGPCSRSRACRVCRVASHGPKLPSARRLAA